MFDSKIVNINKSGEVVYLSFKIFDDIDFVKNAISTRYGGVSEGAMGSMNLGTSTKDKWENVVQNYNIFCTATDFDINRLVLAKQTHLDNVLKVDSSYAGCGVVRERFYDNIDALVTNEKNLPLVIHTADCVPVTLVDVKNKCIGAAHCGWRGTYSSLAAKTLSEMNKHYGTHPDNVVAAIGPCVCKNCYEVSKELFEDFRAKFGYENHILNEKNKYYLDLANINKCQLMDMGVKEHNIAVCDVCTCCNNEHLYSHRGLGAERGIFSNIIAIKR